MSDKAKVDWEFCKGLYLRGCSRKEICAQTGATDGALDRQITRGGWRKLKDRLPVERIPIETRRTIIRDGLAADLQQSVQHLPQIAQSTNPEKALVRAQLVSTLAGASEKVVGRMEGRLAINIGLLQMAADSAKLISPSLNGTKVIDVVSEPVSEPIL